MFGYDIGIDLGTASVLVYVKGRGIVVKEPSVVAVNKNDNSVIEVGTEAQRMIGRTPGNIAALRPLRDGAISDYDITEKMLKYFIKKVIGKSVFSRKPRIAVCVPSAVTEVERRSVEDAARQAGARQVFTIEEPIAAAIGAGIDISQARGSMVVDIGGGTTDVAVIALGGCVVSTSIKVAGDNFDEAIIKYIRKKHNLLIGERSAEYLKLNIGTAYRGMPRMSMEVSGRNLITGMPHTLTVTSAEIYEALRESVTEIAESVHKVMENTPPELVSDITDRGMVMTGGSSLLNGFDILLSERMGINAVIADDPVSCAAYGTGKYIEHISQYKSKYILIGDVDK